MRWLIWGTHPREMTQTPPLPCPVDLHLELSSMDTVWYEPNGVAVIVCILILLYLYSLVASTEERHGIVAVRHCLSM